MATAMATIAESSQYREEEENPDETQENESMQQQYEPSLPDTTITGSLHSCSDEQLPLPDPEQRPQTAQNAGALSTITTNYLIERMGVYDLTSAKELILRDKGLTGIQDTCAEKLVSLEVLSLSHNKLSLLTGFHHFSSLIELNINFNIISSLHELQCPGLEKLFASNNKITDISPLRSLVKLNTVSVYGNAIIDLDTAVHTCRALPKLRSLDLGGNPCSQNLDGYKFQIVRLLPRLKALDGEQITQLDKDLSEEFTLQGKYSNGGAVVPLNGADARPFTAPVGGRGLTARLWETPLPMNKPFDAFASKHMPKGNVRLFRDDFLNNNAILLEYLAQETHQPITPRVEYGLHGGAGNEREEGTTGNGSNFVEKMRSANPLGLGSQDAVTPDNVPEEQPSVLTEDEPLRTPISARPLTAATIALVQSTNLGIDPSDPKTTIRKLIKHIEVLEESLASYKTRQVEAAEEELSEECRRLQIENNNIPLLQEQVTNLKKQLDLISARPCPPPTSTTTAQDSAKDQQINKLKDEIDKMRRENARLKLLVKENAGAALSKSIKVTKDEHSSSHVKAAMPHDPEGDQDSSALSDVNYQPQRLSKSTLLDESAAMDIELTELILQNEVSLEMIRHEINNTKKEWEAQFEQARQTEQSRQLSRPQTSLGLTPSLSRASLANNAESLQVGQSNQGSHAGTVSIRKTRPRQLHTSAGFSHGTGPEEHLLEHTASKNTSVNGTSATNILTL